MKRILFLFAMQLFCAAMFAEPLSQQYETPAAHKESETEKTLPEFFTLKDKLQYEFDNLHWLDGKALKTPKLAIPYNIGETAGEVAYTYAQANAADAIQPELEGLGALDYFGVPYTDMQYCEKLAASIQKKTIDTSAVSAARQFVKYFFETVLNALPPVQSVFYGRPELTDDMLRMQFRLNFSETEAGLGYAIAKAGAVYEHENLLLCEFEIGKMHYEKIKQN